MQPPGGGHHPAPGGALQKAELQQIGLHHRFQSDCVFSQACSQGVQAHRPPAIALQHQGEQAPITGIEAPAIDPVQAQGPIHEIGADAAMALHGGHIPHPPQQSVGNPGRAPAAPGHLQGRIRIQLQLQEPRRPLHNRLEILEAVKLQPLDQAEAIPQGRTERAGLGGGPHQGEWGQGQGAGAGRGALAHGEIEAKVLHGRVEDFFGDPVEPVDLINEQQLLGLEVHQQAHDVAGALQGRGTGDAAAHAKFFGQHQGHGGFAQARGAIEQHVVEGFLTAAGGLNGNAQHLLEFALADVVGQALGPEAVFPGRGLFLDRRWIHQPRALHRLGRHGLGRPGAATGGRRSRGNNRHTARVPGAI